MSAASDSKSLLPRRMESPSCRHKLMHALHKHGMSGRHQRRLHVYTASLSSQNAFREHLFCALTGQLIKASVEAARKHMKGQRFLKAKGVHPSVAACIKPLRSSRQGLLHGHLQPAAYARQNESLSACHLWTAACKC